MLPSRPHMAAWHQRQQAARGRAHAPRVAVFAGNVSFCMTDLAARIAERAGVRHAVELTTADALQRPPPAPTGTMMLNPPCVERMAPKGAGQGTGQGAADARGSEHEMSREGFDGGGRSAEFFSALADHWKRQHRGWTAWCLSSDMKLPSLMRLKETRRVPMWNGPIECRLFRVDRAAGSNTPGEGVWRDH